MNGKEYDRILEELDTIMKSDNSDVKNFCINIRDWVLDTREYRYNDFDTQDLNFLTSDAKKLTYGAMPTNASYDAYNKLNNHINEEKFNKEALDTARGVLRTLKDFYSRQLTRKTLSYNKKVKKEIFIQKIILNLFRVLDYTSQTIIILGAITIPFILNITELPKIIPTIISAGVAVAAALSRYYKFGERSIILDTLVEETQKELTLHESGRGPYSGPIKGAALDLLMNTIDKIQQEQKQAHITLKKKIQDQAKELEQMRSKQQIE